MEMMDSVARMAMEMNSTRFATEYSMAVTKKVMDNQEMAAQQMLQMLPPPPPKGSIIDTYA